MRPRTPMLLAAMLAVVALPAAGRVAGGGPDDVIGEALRRRLAAAAPDERLEALVRFADGDLDAHADAARRLGVGVGRRFDVFRGAHVWGTGRALEALAAAGRLRHMEPLPELRFYGATEGWAVRSTVAQRPVSGGAFRDGAGNVIDGGGVGIAIIDSGLDATHPDLAGAVARQFAPTLQCLIRFVATGECVYPYMTEVPASTNTDSVSGHGTFVAGMAAGDGSASQGTYVGVAPGATLYGFRIAATSLTVSPLAAIAAYEYIYEEYESFTPRIKVVNNSWGDTGGTRHDPDGLLETAIRMLVQDKGVTVVFAAGNDGDGGDSGDQTSSYCKDPTPGVICVANYDDLGTGSRSGGLDSSSSRGRPGSPATYPDISAPGAAVTSTCLPSSGVLCPVPGLFVPSIGWPGFYATGSGTSFSAPMVSGAAAMLVQADPTLTPAEVEDTLLDTALKFSFGRAYESDPQNLGETTSSDKGAGLLDLVEALTAAGAAADGSRPNGVAVASGDGGDVSWGRVDLVGATVTRGATGITVAATVRNYSDAPPAVVPALSITQIVAGVEYRTFVDLLSAGPEPWAPEEDDLPATAEASSASRSGNTVTFVIPYAEIGDPAADEPAHGVFVSSFLGVIVDVAPGPGTPSVGADTVLRPVYSFYTVRT